jgi:3-hydroxy-9,10-secoandrosta-1,3,5(10)-triene-9,17-dione monooxygenase
VSKAALKIVDPVSGPEILTPKSSHSDWLSPDELKELTVEKIVARVTALQPLITAKARQAEIEREADHEVWSALRKTGIFYLMVPQSRGGLEEGLQAFIDVILPIGKMDASLAWTAAFSVMHQWQIAQFPAQCQKEIWDALPYVTSAGSAFPQGKAVKVEGGFILSAHHKYCSGIMHSEWANSVAAFETPEGEKKLMLAMLPIDAVQVLDTWYVDGMAGTGSHDIVYKDVFVPDHMIVMMDDIRQGNLKHKVPAYRIPFSSFLGLVVAVPTLAAAMGEVERFRGRLLTPGPDGSVPDKPLARAGLARVSVEVKAAELLIRDSARDAEELAAKGLLTSAERARIRAQYSVGAKMCLGILRSITDLSSSSVHMLSHPTQRALRDVTMISSHATLETSSSLDDYGRNMLNMPSLWFLA